MARQYHPDLHPNDAAAAEKFKEINEANEVLSNETKRKNYDAYGDPNGNMGGFGGFGGFGGGSSGFSGFEDIFGDIFGFGNRGARTKTKQRGEDITLELSISFLDAAKGCKREISYQRSATCKTCNGTGAKGGTAYKTCEKCGGSGEIQYVNNNGIFRSVNVRTCPDCNQDKHSRGGYGQGIRLRDSR